MQSNDITLPHYCFFLYPCLFTQRSLPGVTPKHRIDLVVYSCNIPTKSRDRSLPTYLYDRNIRCVMTTSSRPRSVSRSISRLWGCLADPMLGRNYRHRPPLRVPQEDSCWNTDTRRSREDRRRMNQYLTAVFPRQNVLSAMEALVAETQIHHVEVSY
jgi:hypothetical protein